MATRKTTRSKSKQSGLTLIEIMVVLVILGAIATAVGISVLGQLEDSRKRDTKVRARTIGQAAGVYMMDAGTECPTVQALLGAGILDATTDTKDGWGNDFVIECEGIVVHVHSAGPDGTHGNDDDIGF